MTQPRYIKGHGLLLAGWPYTEGGRRRPGNGYGSPGGEGFGKCRCGALSPTSLPNTAARKRWHKAHKAEILVERLGS